MKIRITQNAFAAACVASFLAAPVHAETTVRHKQFLLESRLMTVGGTLAVRANRKDDMATDLVLKGKVVATIDSDSVTLDYKFSVRGRDAVLLHATYGNACPATYHFLLVGAEGKTVFSGKDGFGNCDDRATLSYDDTQATLSIPAPSDGRPSKAKLVERWVWDYSTRPPEKQK